MLNDDASTTTSSASGATWSRAIPAAVPAPGVPLQLRRRQSERDQRVCAARRPDVPPSRHDRSGEERRRSRRRDGARDRARRAASRHRAGDQGRRSFRSAPSPVRSSARSSAAPPAASSRKARSFGLGAYFLKYGREYERQADLLGAQIMARAGYDPRRWPTCSAPSSSRAAAADRSG